MDIKHIQALAQKDMTAVNNVIYSQINSDVALINQLGVYIVNAGGKRMRPMLTVLAARAFGYQGNDHISIAAIIEFIHTATLLHDDVVDESNMRRGRETANALFGNSASVLVGDFLYTRSFQMMTKLGNMRIMDILSDTTNIVAEGEVLQLMNCNDPSTTEESYFQVIYCKTAKLFEAATRLAAVIAGQDEKIEKAMQEYGKYLGTAFQLVDDIMDYTADAKAMGKNIGDDLAEGKPTLPLLYAMKHGNAQQKQLISDAIEHCNGMEHLDEILAAMEQTGSLVYTQKQAEREADKAIDALKILPESEHKQALISLAHIAANRSV
ncbi:MULTISPECIES: octaprenyl diphosphate synthase [unclassified Colwellia]|jgi:octaprenyl-diphosphate synthase|uniref:octaprenyl diphosphate synthase n=1 Tax=unclassified Colwellia TaxID=196834 RepID=UPI0015F5E6CC|nr:MULTISPECIES: octaprenyl diphosphate synthase [unclassified Colwellia]MBA6364548.1 octaprenyl diphosphate synthase [Colwellia sp. BRX8-8]MBA6336856.1 octaprenyl diphosphate synthase [Colwellia sp. BRX8-7]MBA6348273.1 octaprenyl diphosphate synthase [Colwellia sp. BRX8-9]MBA6351457.1 octaprenyl diphosphate synthase [Colwellia sp. BRX9-1]MBA6370793.1 octaprenyl diphosphate synthase [Colwellia sp. BRX8-4]|tara:strand:- start:1452 stop:2423 length:972 start_codon:yes stop_codon:yes gene_type:complete